MTESIFLSHRVPASDYNGGHRVSSISASVEDLIKVIGEPHWRTDDDFPDDDYKCDVCWGLKHPETGAEITIWSYKEWHYNDQQIDTEERVGFSVYYTDEGYFKELEEAVTAIQ